MKPAAAHVLAIGLVWAALFLPSLERRAFHFEEGRHALAARDVLHHGHWLLPEVYGVRFVEKPPLFPIVIAASAWALGDLGPWAVRIGPLVAVLLCGYLVFWLTVRRAGMSASLLATGCWFLNPEVLNKARVGEPALVNVAFVFGAFVVWWSSVERGRVTLGRWLWCGLLLMGAAATKGPQHIAYFALGVLGYLVYQRSWRDLPGYCVAVSMPALFVVLWGWVVYQPGDAQVWLTYMRLQHAPFAATEYARNMLKQLAKLVLELLPAIVLAIPLWVAVVRRRTAAHRELALALLFYAGVTTAILIPWPGTSSRYALPAFPAVCVAAGLMAEALLKERTRLLVRGVIAMLFGAVLYQLALVLVVMPRWPDLFNRNQRLGHAVNLVIASDAAPAFITANELHNIVYYLDKPVRQISLGEAASMSSSWIIAPGWQMPVIRDVRASGTQVMFDNADPPFVVVRLDGR